MITEERKSFSNASSENNDNNIVASVLAKPLVDVSTGLFLLRLILAIVFIAHGGQKVFGWFGGHGLEGTATFMATLGIPKFLSYIASLTEFFGGVALLFGVLTRPAALGLAITMIVGIVKAHLSGGFFAPNGFEYALTLAFIAVAVFLLGAGKYSVDEKLFNK